MDFNFQGQRKWFAYAYHAVAGDDYMSNMLEIIGMCGSDRNFPCHATVPVHVRMQMHAGASSCFGMFWAAKIKLHLSMVLASSS